MIIGGLSMVDTKNFDLDKQKTKIALFLFAASRCPRDATIFYHQCSCISMSYMRSLKNHEWKHRFKVIVKHICDHKVHVKFSPLPVATTVTSCSINRFKWILHMSGRKVFLFHIKAYVCANDYLELLPYKSRVSRVPAQLQISICIQ